MDFPKWYFEDEVRDGFLIPALLKKNWAMTQKIHSVLNALCEEHGIRNYADWGTLLGAVRHAGFVPWDDDLDISMKRKDYSHLWELNKTGKIPEGYYCVDYNVEKDENIVRKFMNCKIAITHPDDWDKNYGFPFGDLIDIFILDYMPRDEEERSLYIGMIDIISTVREVLFKRDDDTGTKEKNEEEKEEKEEKEIDDEKLQYYLDKIQELLVVRFDEEKPVWLQLMNALDDFAAEYTEKQCDEVMELGFYHTDNTRIYPHELYADWIRMDFELGSIHVPVGYDGILRRLFGDYMMPVRGDSSHDYPWFTEVERQLFEKTGMKILRYPYEKEKIEGFRQKKQEKISLAKELSSYIDMLVEAHEFIVQMCEQRTNLAIVADLLEQCQNLAIEMGNRMEERAVCAEEPVAILEDYCGLIFELYQWIQKVAENPDCEEGSGAERLFAYQESIQEYVREQLREKREIVFLPYKSSHWPSLHSLWEEAVKSEDTIVTVIPVPWYYKDFTGRVEEEQMQLQTEGYPEQVTLTSYTEYNFEVHHPDVVIYQYPYDNYNYSTCVHPFFYASNLRQYVEKMVFIPPFILNEIGKEDNSARYTLKTFINNPGLMFADQIFVQSEQMRETYIELLDEFTEGKEEVPWNDRIFGTGSPIWDWENESRVIIGRDDDKNEWYSEEGICTDRRVQDMAFNVPEEWDNGIRKGDGSRKKILLYYVSGSVLYEHQEKTIQKIQDTLEYMESYREDIVVLWYLDPYAKDILETRRPEIWEKYTALIDEYGKKDYILIEWEKDCCRVVNFAHGFYGDGGKVMNDCRIRKIPVLWENPAVDLNQGGTAGESHWTEEMVIADEKDWNLNHFLTEMMSYKRELPADNARKIWKEMMSAFDEKK